MVLWVFGFVSCFGFGISNMLHTTHILPLETQCIRVGMHAVVVFDRFQVGGDVALRFQRGGHRIFDLRGDAMCLANRHRVGKEQVDLNPVASPRCRCRRL